MTEFATAGRPDDAARADGAAAIPDQAVVGAVRWFEIATADVNRAAGFYGGLFGWQPQGDPDVYLMLPPKEGAIAGGIMPAPPEVGPYALFGVEVDDVDAAHHRAVALGATSVVPPTDNPGGVRSAYLRDPDGSLFSVYRFGPPAA